MIVLAIDTALEACSAAVVSDGLALAVRYEAMVRGHQERLAPVVADAMAEADLAFAELDRLVVTVGPGSFTGLRVGLAFAKAMALALDIPCVGVGTLEALAAGASLRATWVAAVLDARRDHVYLQTFTRGAARMEACILPIKAAAATIVELGDPADVVLVGAGAALIEDTAAAGAANSGVVQIDPLVLARLGAARTRPGHAPQPLYLRGPDARTLAERASSAV